MLNQSAKTDLELMVGNNEHVLWQGHPNKKCYILESIFNPFLPFALFWGAIDIFAFGIFVFADFNDASNSMPSDFNTIPLILFFFLFHMMPVWLYLIGILLIRRRYNHTQYIVTDKGVYISGGTFAYTCRMKPFTEISRIEVHRGIFDQYLNVGDVVFTATNSEVTNNSNQLPFGFGNFRITDIPDYREVFELVRKLQTDIFADTMYPNDLRPKENHGYKTKYMG